MGISSKELGRLERQYEEAKKQHARLSGEYDRAKAALASAIAERREAMLDGDGSDPKVVEKLAERAALTERALENLKDAAEWAAERANTAETAWRETRDLAGREKLAGELMGYLTKIESALAAAREPAKALVSALLECPVAESAQAGAFLGEAMHSVARELRAIESGLKSKAAEILRANDGGNSRRGGTLRSEGRDRRDRCDSHSRA
jgi:chromosome segregation ATPase